MMEMFQRSRPTVREALRMLEHNGYLRAVPGGGFIVTDIDDMDMEQVMEDAIHGGCVSLLEMGEYRTICEVNIAAWAAERRTDADLKALREHLSRMRDVIGDCRHFIRMDPDFHCLIAEAAKNQVAVMMSKTLSGLNRGFMEQKMRSMTVMARKRMCRRVQLQHQAVFDAIAAGDLNAAQEAMNQHMESFQWDLQADAIF